MFLEKTNMYLQNDNKELFFLVRRSEYGLDIIIYFNFCNFLEGLSKSLTNKNNPVPLFCKYTLN